MNAATAPDPAEIEITGTLQREAWLARSLPPVEQLRTDLWSIPVPIPDNPLRYMSSYVFHGAGGLTLIDAGWNSDVGWDALTAGLAGIGASVSDVRGILVTHMHFDHIGLAKRVREASGAWVCLHPADRDVLAHADFQDPQRAVSSEARWLVSLGATPAEADALVGTPDEFSVFADIAMPDRLLQDGERADVPGWTLRAVHTPGHTPGHLCFADEETGLFFGGDHILPRISPNISASRNGASDPLGSFLSSLRAVRDLAPTEVLPAHEWRFKRLDTRVDQLLLHHQHRLDELLDAVREHPGAVPWDLAGYLTWSRPWDQYDGRMRIFAVSETMAHLLHLLVLGRVTRTDGDVPTYHAAR